MKKLDKIPQRSSQKGKSSTDNKFETCLDLFLLELTFPGEKYSPLESETSVPKSYALKVQRGRVRLSFPRETLSKPKIVRPQTGLDEFPHEFDIFALFNSTDPEDVALDMKLLKIFESRPNLWWNGKE